MMTIGLVSLWHNAIELLPEFKRLLAIDDWNQAVLVDNASSTDAEIAYQKVAQQTGCQVLRMESNNVVAGWNAGMALLSTDILVCMANDVIMIHPDWLYWATQEVAPGVLAGPYLRIHDGVPYLDGSLIAIHRIDWARLGGLDGGYEHPGYVSDVDLCWRAVQMGMTLLQCRLGVCHLERYTAGPPERNRETWLRNRKRLLDRIEESRADLYLPT